MRALLFWVPAILAVLFVAGRETADATILIKKNLAQLAAESERIVIAEVGAQSGAYAKGTRVIFTYTELAIEATLKGTAETRMSLAEVGGTVGNLTTMVEGMPRFATGERVLLFLKKDALGQWRCHGAVQGRFPVIENIATGERLVKLDPAMAHVHRSYFQTEGDPIPRTVTVEEFQAKLKTLIARAGEKKETK